MKIAIIGATGMVGRVILEILEERNFLFDEIYFVASQKSFGEKIKFKNKNHSILTLEKAIGLNLDLIIFSAGGEISKNWAPEFAKKGAFVIDNSSFWRMNPSKKLIVPEINAHTLSKEDKIIANPNCSTIQLVMAIYPIHQKYKIKRIIVSTYQAVSGSGKKALDQLEKEELSEEVEKFYSHPIYRNVLAQCDEFEENGYTKEELKIMKETRKILNDSSIAISATAVRVPLARAHCESVNMSLEKDFNLKDIKEILSNTPGIKIEDDPKNKIYPQPIYAKDKDEVFVGRIRRDETYPNSLNLWIVADNLRKGAALNAIQIAEYLVKNDLLGS